MSEAIRTYLKAIEASLRQGDATEHTHRPAIVALLLSLGEGLAVTNEPRQRTDCGAPDVRVARRTGSGPTALTLGYIETKDIGKNLSEIEDSDQLKRYRRSLGNLILTDYLEFRWYVDGQPRQAERLASVDRNGKLSQTKDGTRRVHDLLSAFLAQQPEPINRPKDLAVRMARLTHLVRDIIVLAFAQKQASNMMQDLHQAFQETLIPDLPAEQFADMFAQTLAYGLFSARVMDPSPADFSREEAQRLIPKTNPFLRKLFSLISGVEMDDEPFAGFVNDLVQTLAQADIGAILADFGKRDRKTDPVVHFYETFLAAYDPKLREARGVYYTPEPVVSYIVRSVDYLLKTRFNCPGGLADENTVTYETRGDDGQTRQETAPRVLILDPACGTGTFLYAVVDLIRERFMQQGNAGMWSGFVQRQLLPRLFGFELLMAPYAVAHFKLGLQLAGHDLPEAQRRQWAYDFMAEERLGVYLTNSLEAAEEKVMTLFGPMRAIAEEANAAAQVKRDKPIMVVTGNPPYSGNSANRSWIKQGSKTVPTFIGGLLQDYYQVDGKPLDERNPKMLQDDYVKFLRFAQWRIEETGHGVVALITNNGYLDNPTFRGMRQQLMGAFSQAYILNLHGSAKKRETSPDGSQDENVFDIQQGVAIGIFIKDRSDPGTCQLYYADLWGEREPHDQQIGKYGWLIEHSMVDTDWKQLSPKSPFYLFVPQNLDYEKEHQGFFSVSSVFTLARNGVKTHRDHFAVATDRSLLLDRIRAYRNISITDEQIRARFGLVEVGSWSLSRSRKQLQDETEWIGKCVPYLYRPLDQCYVFLHQSVVERPRLDTTGHILAGQNLVLGLGRQGIAVSSEYWDIVTCARFPMDENIFRRGGVQQFPLYLYEKASHQVDYALQLTEADHWSVSPSGRRPNLNRPFVADVEQRLGLHFVSDGVGDLQTCFGPEDIFHYMYAVFHAPSYRSRYAEFLKIDFPRLPLTTDLALFRTLAAKGAELVALHLIESPALGNRITSYPVPGNNLVDKGFPRYRAPGEAAPGTGERVVEGRVYINKEQYVAGVAPDVWQFHIGGYPVCDKWLKDRRGRQLSYDDLTHYQKIVVVLKETIRLMADIDATIPGWPLPGSIG